MNQGSLPLLIIGNGGAAVHAALGARQAGFKGRIRLVADREGPAFNPMLAPYYLAGSIPFERCFPFGADFYIRHELECLFGSPVEYLDPRNREVRLADNRKIPYEKCLLATGASPVLPGVPGLRESSRVFTLRTASDTTRLADTLPVTRKAAILGASLVGLKVAEIFVHRGIETVLIDVAPQILPPAALPECASSLENHILKNGVQLRLSAFLEHLEETSQRAVLHFKEGPPLEADLCLVCTGVRANLDFLDPTWTGVDRGIIVNHRLETQTEGIYAAGDVSQGTNLLTGKKEVLGLWGNACYQGRCAGINMAGGRSSYPGSIPDHVSTFFGIHFVHLGDVHRQGSEIAVLSGDDGDDGVKFWLVFEGKRLVGANLLGNLEHAGRLRRTILLRLDWGEHLSQLRERLSSEILDRALCTLLPAQHRFISTQYPAGP
ncbi:MAG: FAD-dependent oxidoreductase [Deltaproteobacteria bacterium]|nr:FAD-dependent oxidoreductase [Deltaproteobacteria bacterium]MBW2304721.1 FAD-dependent oxidoreductase [Deltaproteobacteria bacterium]